MTEKRQASRQKSFLRGFAYFDGGSSAVDCLVRDISDTGARLKFSIPVTSPESLELHVPIKGLRYRSKVQWRSGDEIGILFDVAAEAVANKFIDNAELAARVRELEAENSLLKHRLKALQEKNSQANAAA